MAVELANKMEATHIVVIPRVCWRTRQVKALGTHKMFGGMGPVGVPLAVLAGRICCLEKTRLLGPDW